MMPSMTSPLVTFSDNGNSRTFTTTGHTLKKPKVLKQSRVVPQGASVIATNQFAGTFGTEDDDGIALKERDSFNLTVRTAINGQTTDATALVALLKDLVNSDEFADALETQNFIHA